MEDVATAAQIAVAAAEALVDVSALRYDPPPAVPVDAPADAPGDAPVDAPAAPAEESTGDEIETRDALPDGTAFKPGAEDAPLVPAPSASVGDDDGEAPRWRATAEDAVKRDEADDLEEQEDDETGTLQARVQALLRDPPDATVDGADVTASDTVDRLASELDRLWLDAAADEPTDARSISQHVERHARAFVEALDAGMAR